MLVDSKKMKQLRQTKNWTQQHLAHVCDLSIRTIQRVEKDGVASNETVAAYAAIFESEISDLVISVESYERNSGGEGLSRKSRILMGVFFFGGVAAGISLTLWLV